MGEFILFLIIVATHVGLFYTRWGLRVRAVGEHPEAADTVGIRVLFTRYRNVILGGIVAGIGGGLAVLINHLFPRDVVTMVEKEKITGLAAVPPLWNWGNGSSGPASSPPTTSAGWSAIPPR